MFNNYHFRLLNKLILGLRAHIYHLKSSSLKCISVDEVGNNLKFTFIVNDHSNNFHNDPKPIKIPTNYKRKAIYSTPALEKAISYNRHLGDMNGRYNK